MTDQIGQNVGLAIQHSKNQTAYRTREAVEVCDEDGDCLFYLPQDTDVPAIEVAWRIYQRAFEAGKTAGINQKVREIRAALGL